MSNKSSHDKKYRKKSVFKNMRRRKDKVYHGVSNDSSGMNLFDLLKFDCKGLMERDFYVPPRPLYEVHNMNSRPVPVVDLSTSYLVIGILSAFLLRKKNNSVLPNRIRAR